jgi:DNA gyrase subunit A
MQDNISQLPITNRTKDTNIVSEMKSSYINYAMSVIVARALPEVRDGLKPVQRRILYAMYKQGFTPDKAYKKSARTVGEVIGKYHPHGDTAVYDAMVRLAQDFNVRYTLIDGQGNFGSIDGDSPAAMRYTESRLHKNALDVLHDLDKHTVDFVPTYDGSYREPVLLPSNLPLLLLNGAEGIAVGMATKIPPHNLTEIIDALLYIIKAGNIADNSSIDPNYAKQITDISSLNNLPSNRFPDFQSNVSLDELISIVKGPDFPTGAEIYDIKAIEQMYATGKGRVIMKAISHIEETKSGKYQIIITELPYQVNKARLVSKIADLVRDKKIEGIADLRDESTKDIRIVLDIKRDGKPNTILNKLYKYTEMQSAFNANMLALVNGEPKLLTLKKILELFIKHRQEIIIKRSEFELAKAKEREHILEGLMIALDNLDEVIAIIRNSKDAEIPKANLMQRFNLSEIQSQAILDMQLRKLAALERLKIEEEYKQIKELIKDLLDILATPIRVLSIISDELKEIKLKKGDPRKTKVYKHKLGEVSDEELIAQEDVIVTVSEQGYIKRMSNDIYKVQKRGGVGKKGMATKEDDSVAHIFSCNTHDDIMFFTNKGRVFIQKVYEIPESSRTSKGQPIIRLINIDQNELVTSVLTKNDKGKLYDEDTIQENEKPTERADYKYLFMATRKGIVKKTLLADFQNIRSNGLISIKLNTDDELVWVKPTTGNNEVILITRYGKSIRFLESDVRETGRATMGVTGIRFKKNDDYVIVMDVIRKNEDLVLTISGKGFGKVSQLGEFPCQKRGGQGVFAAKITDKTGLLSTARIIDHPQADLLIISEQGQVVRIPTDNLPSRSRQTQGVHLMRIRQDDNVTAIAIL